MISVCIATYNGGQFLANQIDSILKQLSNDDEIIVSDDGSTDRTFEILGSYNDKRIKVYRNSFRDPIKNFEYSIKKSQGDLIFLADQDDVWEESKVSIIKKCLESYDLVAHNCSFINENNETLDGELFTNINNSGFFKNLVKNRYCGCCMAFRRNLLKMIIPFPNKIAMHDIWIGLVAECFFNPIIINEKLIQHRLHSSNASPTGRKSHHSIYFKIKYRLRIIVEIFKLIVKTTIKNSRLLKCVNL